ncbi:hypothetical protein EES39_39005 [Streptomyces sp. ADI92-24]|uniref:hypothetical protein n=1 Tax=Streptomyces sp. ADI92-24 TaxID=1522756 RepID=UPI000FBCF505|nr:hypothetical protein [Streptomyces sp. ADI92-24]RPK32306.1 hypothetical protein EES39_39005 [Streptomyces sp. ADI92-24]
MSRRLVQALRHGHFPTGLLVPGPAQRGGLGHRGLAATLHAGLVDRGGASSGTTGGSGNARRLSSRIARFCRSTACAMPGSTWDGTAAWRCASIAWR